MQMPKACRGSATRPTVIPLVSRSQVGAVIIFQTEDGFGEPLERTSDFTAFSLFIYLIGFLGHKSDWEGRVQGAEGMAPGHGLDEVVSVVQVCRRFSHWKFSETCKNESL
jgi:hypothetical protein